MGIKDLRKYPLLLGLGLDITRFGDAPNTKTSKSVPSENRKSFVPVIFSGTTTLKSFPVDLSKTKKLVGT